MAVYGGDVYGTGRYRSTGPVLSVEIGLASAVSAFTLDLSQLAPVTAPAEVDELGNDQGFNWVDISEWVLEGVTFRRGSTRSQGPFWRYEAGTASLTLDNLDGRFDPLKLDGPYVSAGVSEIRPNLPVRISGIVGSTSEILWTGVVDAIDIDYNSATYSTAVFRCVDGVAFLQAADLPELSTPVGTGDTVAGRIERILDRVGWPASQRDLDPVPNNLLQSSTLAASAWADILLAADSDAGYVWIDRTGRIVYRSVGAITTTPGLTFSSSLSASGFEFTSVVVSRDVGQVFNSVSLARKNGTTVTVEDIDAQALIGQVRGFSRNDLICQADDEVEKVASWIVGNFGELRTRVESVSLSPPADTELLSSGEWLTLLRLELGELVRVVHTTPDGRDIEVNAIVRGLEWSVSTKAFDLTVSLQTTTADVVLFVLDDVDRAVLGGTDSGVTYAGNALSLIGTRS